MKITGTKICILLTVISVILAAVILILTNFGQSFLLHGNETKRPDLMSDAPSASNSSPWRHNISRDAIRAKQSEVMQSFINESVDPCDDFYEYACGNWEKHNPIPNDKWQYSTIQLLHHNLENELRELLMEPISHEKPPSAMDKAKMYYKNCVDKEATAKRGVEPLLKFVKDLGGWPVLDENWNENEFDWIQLAINSSYIGNGVIIAYEVEKNPTISTEYTIFMEQTTLGMTNRDNFLKPENSKNLEAYRNLIERVLLMLDVNAQKAKNVSHEIVNFEILLANATVPPESTKTLPYFQPPLSLLKSAYAYLDWNRYIAGIQQKHSSEINENQTVLMQLGVQYYENLYYVLLQTENVTMANYMIWRSVLFVMISLDDNFRGAWDDFNTAVTGQVEPNPLWKICVNQVNWNMGMATSGMFIRKYFDESSKNETIKIINSLKETFDENLSELEWIDDGTKSYASKKANAMRIAAGYPDYIRSEKILNKLYQDIEIMEGKHFENCLSLTKHTRQKSRDRLFKPFDKDHWFLPPTMVNALYDTGANRIIILAGLLQPPVFHKYFPQSLNYGAMGMFMGHELIHGFDDIGRKFDVVGNSLKWWSNESIAHFEERQKCFLEQYEVYAKKDQTFKSIATLSENLADNGGLRLAFKAYKKWQMTNNNSKSIEDETFPKMKFNEEQLFFLSFAQLFCSALRPEALVESRSYEAHSPRKYRVLGALTNFDEFSKAYGCPLNSTMNPVKKCRLW
ncbi:neprilysin-4-like [Episyrphus balteatus]|uniref:neprilysin-4-like n=1 Tax=Episyrphus balteatus TaxID=286459 RepID=UPI0024867AEF|nr:neprilysin-4-like [Episyrphus balteatus]